MKPTACQQIILWSLFIEPEDPRGFKKYKNSRRQAKRMKNPVARKKARESSARWNQNNPERMRRNNQKWNLENSERNTETKARWRAANLDRDKKNILEWRNKNRERVNKTRAQWQKERRKRDPSFRLRQQLASRIGYALRGRGAKSATTLSLLGCTVTELWAHLEKRFRSGMTRENYGPVWHVDHIKPCAKFDLTDPVQQRECFHFSNLQPLFSEENLKKGAKYLLPT